MAEIEKRVKPLYETLKEGIVLYSSVTSIYYKVTRGKLMKFPRYGGAEQEWAESRYTGPKKACMKVVDAKEIGSLR